MSERVLVVDDEEVFRRNLCRFLDEQGFRVEEASDGCEALERIRNHDVQLVLADIKMPELDGLELLDRLGAERPDTLVILMTAYASMEDAIEGFRRGAYDYVLKPITFEDLEQKIDNALTENRLRRRIRRLRRQLDERLGFEGIVGDSPPMREVFEKVEKVADLPTNVLVTGESGTGKELVARAIHDRSSSSDLEFRAVNTSAISSDVLESQLFGAEKGAYTGAHEDREGVFRSVRGGTIFLDEVGEIPPESQAKLLRAIEQQQVLPVGASEPVEVDFRLIAATNQDLEAMVDAGDFREDLFYRLNVFRIELPPLRDRRDDIPLLVEHFAEVHARALGRPVPTFSNRAMKALVEYRWPGNVRELSNLVERALILSD
ncbi:MAG: sigma-54-dependent transcriptional regulator, partial [Bradymonadaceae bacterium]